MIATSISVESVSCCLFWMSTCRQWKVFIVTFQWSMLWWWRVSAHCMAVASGWAVSGFDPTTFSQTKCAHACALWIHVSENGCPPSCKFHWQKSYVALLDGHSFPRPGQLSIVCSIRTASWAGAWEQDYSFSTPCESQSCCRWSQLRSYFLFAAGACYAQPAITNS